MYFVFFSNYLKSPKQFPIYLLKKNLCVNGSMQSKPMLFKGQLYLFKHSPKSMFTHVKTESERFIYSPRSQEGQSQDLNLSGSKTWLFRCSPLAPTHI